jgi:predicted phosphatase
MEQQNKIFRFETELFGNKKVFHVHGKDYNEARKKLDSHILNSLKIESHKDVTPKKDFSFNDMFKKFGDIFEGSGFSNIFGGKK